MAPKEGATRETGLEEERAERGERQDGRERGEEAQRLDVLARTVVGAGLKVHRTLGPGLLERVYEHCLARELEKIGVRFARQEPLAVVYEGEVIEAGYRLDILVEDRLVVEIKAVEALSRLHEAQLLTYLKLSSRPLGILMNFNVPMFRQGLRRSVVSENFRD